MGIYEILLVYGALVPAVILGVYIYIKDRAEKEPIGLLFFTLFIGALTVIPILIVSLPVESVFETIFNPIPEYAASLWDYTYFACDALSVGIIEEGFKWLALLLITRNNKHFNSLFDGIVYAVFVSLGFAAAENILYCLDYGFATVITRAITAVPGHVFFGVMMGYFYSLWYMNKKAKNIEISYKNKGLIDLNTQTFPVVSYAILSYAVPVLAHAFYDFGLFTGTVIGALATFAFLIFMYVFCFIRIRKISKQDTIDTSYVNSMLVNKYPHLRSYIYPPVVETTENEVVEPVIAE